MKHDNKKYKIYSNIILLIISIFGIIAIISLFQSFLYKSGSLGRKFWLFWTLTSFIAMVSMFFFILLVEKKFNLYRNEKKIKKKEPWTKNDKIIAFMIFGGLIFEGIVVIGFAYITLLIPYQIVKEWTIFNISFIIFIYIIFWVGLGMVCIGLFLITIYHLKGRI